MGKLITLNQLTAMLARIPDNLDKTERIDKYVNRYAKAFVADARRSFREERSPDGRMWKQLDERTARRKVAGGRRRGEDHILQVTRNLLRSIEASVSRGKLTVSSDVVYSSVHQHGYPPGNIPARPYLGFRRETVKREIDDIVKKLLMVPGRG